MSTIRNAGSRWAAHVLLFTLSCIIVRRGVSLPICTDFTAPTTPSSPLTFCSQYSSLSCCNNAEDTLLRDELHFLRIADDRCREAMKQILCSRCDPYSGHLYGLVSHPKQNEGRKFPYICSPSPSTGFCYELYGACASLPLSNSPLLSEQDLPALQHDPNLQVAFRTVYPSEIDFCNSSNVVPSNPADLCFEGKPYTFDSLAPFIESENAPVPGSVCVEKISKSVYLQMVPHPDATQTKAFFVGMAGKIILTALPKRGKSLDEGSLVPFMSSSTTFLDISKNVSLGGTSPFSFTGLISLAFHPDFLTNGRFFVSYVCDSSTVVDCIRPQTICTCADDATVDDAPDCDKAAFAQKHGLNESDVCRFVTVVAEYSAVSPMAPDVQPAKATVADPQEVRVIMSIARPTIGGYGGQIRFGGTNDPFLFVMLGDGSNSDSKERLPFAQSKKSPFGKVLRVSVDAYPMDSTIQSEKLFGSYSVPTDNPLAAAMEGAKVRKEIFAKGLRNPWKCSVDMERPALLFCGDQGESVQEMDIVLKGGDYGWPSFEGIAAGGGTNEPNLEYKADSPNSAIVGGVVSRTSQDYCLYGRYVFSDFAGSLRAATESPLNSGTFTQSPLNISCAKASPLPCKEDPTLRRPDYKFALSFAQDTDKDLYFFTDSGVYRIVNPSRCNLPACMDPALAISLSNVTAVLANGSTLTGAAAITAVATGEANVTAAAAAAGGTSSGSGPRVFDTNYYIKVVIVMVVLICFPCLALGYCLYMGREEEKNKKKMREQIAQLLGGGGRGDEDDEGMVGVVGDLEGGGGGRRAGYSAYEEDEAGGPGAGGVQMGTNGTTKAETAAAAHKPVDGALARSFSSHQDDDDKYD